MKRKTCFLFSIILFCLLVFSCSVIDDTFFSKKINEENLIGQWERVREDESDTYYDIMILEEGNSGRWISFTESNDKKNVRPLKWYIQKRMLTFYIEPKIGGYYFSSPNRYEIVKLTGSKLKMAYSPFFKKNDLEIFKRVDDY